jgi:chemotaxis regulatin CheY-phosphate phosphatase CheZ
MSKKSKYILAAPAVLAFIPNQVAAKTSDLVEYAYKEDFQEFSPNLLRKVADVSTEVNSVAYRVNTGWNKKLEAKFDELAIKHALDEITSEEQTYLERIQSIRLQELAPRSYDEIMREFEIEKATKNALEAINQLSRTLTCYWPTTLDEKKA